MTKSTMTGEKKTSKTTLEICNCQYCRSVYFPFGYYRKVYSWRKSSHPIALLKRKPFEFTDWLKSRGYDKHGFGNSSSDYFPEWDIYLHEKSGMVRYKYENGVYVNL